MGLVRMFWNEGGAYVFYAESPGPSVPAAGRVILEHVALSLGIEHSAVRMWPCSNDEHRVAVAVETVSCGDRFAIDGHDLLAARKRRHQHEQ